MAEEELEHEESVELEELKEKDVELKDLSPQERIERTTISYSRLRTIQIAGAKSYHQQYILKKRKPLSDAQILGIATHKNLLEPDDFLNDFIVSRKFDRRKTKDKEEYAELVEKAKEEKKLIINEVAMEKVREMCAAVMQHPEAAPLLEGALLELELAWKKKAYHRGRSEKDSRSHTFNAIAYVDIANVELKCIADLKVVDGPFNPYNFKSKAKKEGYHMQTGLYLEGFEENGIEMNRFEFILVSPNEPYDVAVLPASKEFIERGAAQQEITTNHLYSCLLTDSWLSYPNKILLEYVPW